MTSAFNNDFECPTTALVFLRFKYLESSPLRDFSFVLSKKSSVGVFFFALLLYLYGSLLYAGVFYAAVNLHSATIFKVKMNSNLEI